MPGSVVSAIGGAIGGVAEAVVGGISDILGPALPIAAAAFGVPYLMGPTGFSALSAPSILGGGMTGAGMVTSASLGTTLGAGFGGAGFGLGSALASTAGGIGTSSSFLTNLGRSVFSSLSDLGSSITGSINPGEVGGMPTGSSTFGNLTKLIRGGMDIYSAMNYGQGQSPSAAQLAADPYAPYREGAAKSLNMLMSNPNMVYGLPGYQFAQQQGAKNIQRQAASTGQAISGGTLSALQRQGAETAQNWFNNYVNQLSAQAGANQSPAVGQQAYTLAADYQAKAEKARQTALLQGIMGAGSAVAGFFG